MALKSGLLSVSKEVPIYIFISDRANTPIHWHDSIEIVLLLSGECDITVNEDTYKISEDNILLVNSKNIHSYTGTKCNHIICQIQLNELPLLKDKSELSFTVNSVRYPHPTKYVYLKYLMAKLIKVQLQDDANCGTMSVVYELVSELLMNFRSSETQLSAHVNTKYIKRKNAILNYITENYRSGLTLQSVADVQYLSVPYLSSFIKKNIGMTFTSYYNNLRLEHTVNEMLVSDDSIEIIALRNGFKDYRTFLKIFKEKYHILPSAYKKSYGNSVPSINPENKDGSFFHPSIGTASYYSSINKYLNNLNAENSSKSDVRQVRCDDIDMQGKGSTLKHSFHKMCSVSTAKELLYSDVQDMLRTVQKEIGYEYISFYGLLNVDMMVYSEKPDGTPIFTFVLIDKIFDFLLSINLKPLVNFSFMPQLLCIDRINKERTYPYNISAPKDYNKWKLMISNLTEHLVTRYGKESVSEWLFNLWKKPDISLFGMKESDFYRLYQTTYEAVKSISMDLRFGTPVFAFTSTEAKEWDSRFIDFCKSNNCRPDFMCFGYYNDDFGNNDSTFLYLNPQSKLKKNEAAYSAFIDEVDDFRLKKQISEIPAYMLQWNLTVSQRNLINDTCFLSCFVIKNLLENYDRMDSFCYWTITDFAEEIALPSDLFYGGTGMFTHNGVKKACYYAFKFAASLGNELLGRGNGWFVTRHKNKISIIFYNYEHYDDIFANGECYDLTLTKRYTPFFMLQKVNYTLKLGQINADYCTIKEFSVNRNYGSCFDEWVKMGGLPLNDEELGFLKLTQPALLLKTEKINNGLLNIEAELEPLEIRLVEIDFRTNNI